MALRICIPRAKEIVYFFPLCIGIEICDVIYIARA